MTGSSAIRLKALQLLEDVGIDRPRVDVELVAKHLGARIRTEPFDGPLSGALIRQGGQVVIGVNARHPRPRQRFTIAHEIGHLVLHKGNPVHVHLDRDIIHVNLRDETSSRAVDSEEVEANRFAAELLMPEAFLFDSIGPLLREGFATDVMDDAFVRRLASIFDVSMQAMTFRLVNLGLAVPA